MPNEKYNITFLQLLDLAKETVYASLNHWQNQLRGALIDEAESAVPYIQKRIEECELRLTEIERLQDSRGKGILAKDSPIKF